MGGAHYKAEFQHWDFVAQGGLGYFEGQITKYLARHRKKNGLQDVEKAGHFLDKLIELRTLGYPAHNSHVTSGMVSRFLDSNGLLVNDTTYVAERKVIRLIAFWRTADTLLEARRWLDVIARSYTVPPVSAGEPTLAYTNQDQGTTS